MRFRTSHTDSEENHVGSHIVLRANGGNPETKIYSVVEAGENTAVPRSYVDNAVEPLSTKEYVDNAVEPLYTRDYVDQAVADAVAPDLSSYASKDYARDLTYRPARLRWLFEGKDKGNSQPADQSFKFDGDFIRLNFKTLNGVDLGVDVVTDTQAITFTNGPVGIIWYRDGEFKWKMKQQFRINSWRWNYNNHFEFKRSSSHGKGDHQFTVGAAYYITVGGFF